MKKKTNPKSQWLHVRLNDNEREALEDAAKREGKSFSQIARAWLFETGYLSEFGAQNAVTETAPRTPDGDA